MRLGGVPVELTPLEFDLLHHLGRRPGVVFGRDHLLREVWGYHDGSGPRTVDSHIRGLRRKLGSDLIRTARGGRLRAQEAGVRGPLDRLTSIKVKLGVVIVAAVCMTAVLVAAGSRTGLPLWLDGVAAVAIALALVQFLARGMTAPLREMATAAGEMARGGSDRRVETGARDEVGELARAFNRMASELAQVDRERRELIANVSHELRTPIGALRAVLENIVDGIEPANTETLRTMLRQVDRLGRLVAQLLDLPRLEASDTALDRRHSQSRQCWRRRPARPASAPHARTSPRCACS